MGILDDAIREHLELKRQHGAGDSELKEIEDEAFGPPGRPGVEVNEGGAVDEAPTEFLAQPDTGEEGPEDGEPPAAEEALEAPEPASGRREAAADIADLQEAPQREEEPWEPEPADEEQPAGEHDAVSEPGGPSTEERHAISEQPTEMYDVEEELGSSGSYTPTEEELAEEELGEPRLAPVDPLSEQGGAGEETGGDGEEAGPEAVDLDEDDFFDEQRLSDELDQALEAPSEPEGAPEEAPAEEGPAEEPPPHAPDEDVLEETPDFLEEAPEDDRLWFEQQPPKDFDFDD